MNIASKDILARLLASENITVVHKTAPTASFNVRDRVLTLPMWDNMHADTYDHLVGHEVGHALYTPEAGWHESASSKGEIYRQYLNIVEDARIEKMVQTRYPGLRRSFISSYKRMLADGFFGGDIVEINRYSFIDRINTYFKAGRSAGVRIERDEMVWIKKIEQLQTWEEVVALTDELYAFCKERNEDDRAAANQAADEEDYADGEDDSPETDGAGEQAGDEESDDDSDDETESDEKGAGDEESDEEEDEDGDEDYDGDESVGSGYDRDDSGDPEESIASKTDSALRQAISAEHGDDPNVEVTSIHFPTNPVDDLVVRADDIFEMFNTSEFAPTMRATGVALYKQFLVNNKSAIKYMAKEFEMKKSAAEYARQSVSKTGVIDPVKMNSYRYNDDIFRKVSITPDGKNHGMIMYIDWSGSMAADLKPTIDQMLNLVLFCRQVNIPFRVYAFSDRFAELETTSALHPDNASDRQMTYDPRFRLIEFFSSDMNRKKFTEMAENMLVLGNYYNQYSSGYTRGYINYYIPNRLMLGSTPLNESIMAAFKIHDDFKKKTRVDIVNTMFLTDGDSNTSFYYDAEQAPDRQFNKRVGGAFNYIGSKVLYITDPVTKKRKRVNGQRDAITKTLLEFYRDQTGSTTIGYRIMPLNRRQFSNSLPSSVSWEDGQSLYSGVRKEKFAVVPNSGYDHLYLISGGKNLQTANGAIEVERGESKRSVRTAFKKANNDKKSSRKMLSDLISAIA